MSVESRLAEWAAQMPGLRVRPAEHQFITDMRKASAAGVGYGWMQQVTEWEWQTKGPGAWGPEYFEKNIRELAASLAAANAELERLRACLVERNNQKWAALGHLDGCRANLTQANATVGRLEAKAANWDALMNCRMRTLGGAQVTDQSTPYSYLVLEFWTGHPAPTDQPWLREHFEAFMVKARAALTPPAAAK